MFSDLFDTVSQFYMKVNRLEILVQSLQQEIQELRSTTQDDQTSNNMLDRELSFARSQQEDQDVDLDGVISYSGSHDDLDRELDNILAISRVPSDIINRCDGSIEYFHQIKEDFELFASLDQDQQKLFIINLQNAINQI